MSVVRDRQMVVSWRSDDESAKNIFEFVKMVVNATMTGLLEREKIESVESGLSETKEADQSDAR